MYLYELRRIEGKLSEGIEHLTYSIDEAAEAAGISRTKLFAEIRDGHIVARKLGRRTLIERTELDRWLAALPTTKAPQG